MWDTAMDAWPEALQAEIDGFAQVPLERDDFVWMGQALPGFLEAVQCDHVGGPSETLAAELDAHFKSTSGRHHVRLGLISFRQGAGKVVPVTDTRGVLRVLGAANPRVAGLLVKIINEERPASLILRTWLDILPWGEFRTFWRDGRVVGVTQTRPDVVWSEIAAREYDIRTALKQLFTRIKPLLHMDKVVVDVFMTQSDSGLVAHLGELNPYIQRTHPGLFDWQLPEMFDGSFRFRTS